MFYVECCHTWRIDLGISQHVLPLVELLIMLPDQLILALLKFERSLLVLVQVRRDYQLLFQFSCVLFQNHFRFVIVDCESLLQKIGLQFPE